MNWIVIFWTMVTPTVLVVGGSALLAWRAQRFGLSGEEGGCGCDGGTCEGCTGEDILVAEDDDYDEEFLDAADDGDDYEDLDYEVESVADECEFGNFAVPEPDFRVRVKIGSMPDGDSGHSRESGEFQATVLSVSDGRMSVQDVEFHHEVNLATGEDVKMRFLGLDCWEMAQGPAGDLGAEFADHLLEGEEVELQVTGVDRYGRLLTVVPFDWQGQQLDYTALAIRLGRGIRYAGSAFNEGDWTETYDYLEEQAREEGRGVWGFEEVPALPHIFRNGNKSRRRRGKKRH